GRSTHRVAQVRCDGRRRAHRLAGLVGVRPVRARLPLDGPSAIPVAGAGPCGAPWPLWAPLASSSAFFGTPLIIYHEQVSQSFHIVVGSLLLLFGMRWLRKAILRFSGIIATYDEELISQREAAELRAAGQVPKRWDNIGFWFAATVWCLFTLGDGFR